MEMEMHTIGKWEMEQKRGFTVGDCMKCVAKAGKPKRKRKRTRQRRKEEIARESFAGSLSEKTDHDVIVISTHRWRQRKKAGKSWRESTVDRTDTWQIFGGDVSWNCKSELSIVLHSAPTYLLSKAGGGMRCDYLPLIIAK